MKVSLNRREMLRLGAYGAAGALISTAASSSVVGSFGLNLDRNGDPIPPQPQPQAQVLTPSAPAGIDPQLFAKQFSVPIHCVLAQLVSDETGEQVVEMVVILGNFLVLERECEHGSSVPGHPSFGCAVRPRATSNSVTSGKSIA